MADDVEMIPVEATEPPKANPLAASAAPKVATIKLTPMARKPVIGGGAPSALKPGLKLPPKPGMATGLKLPPKPGMATGLKLPPKPGLAPGVKLPTVPLKPGLKLPPKPVIHKPGATVTAVPLSKPVVPLAVEKPVEPPVLPAAENSPAPIASTVPAASKPVVPASKPGMPSGLKLPPKPVIRKPGATVTAVPLPKPVAPLASEKPVAVDAQGVGKLPTVEAKAVDRDDTTPAISANPSPMEALKSVTQKLKGVTQEIPQQAILHKTGIIAEGAMSEAQKEASKHKTARISLSDAMGVAPVKNENAPMKTIRIKRPIDISAATKAETPPEAAAPAAVSETKTEPSSVTAGPAPTAETPAPTMTQRKTLKISRPGGAVRPAGRFGIKRPGLASAAAKPSAAGEVTAPAASGETSVAEVADIPEMPMSAPVPTMVAPANDVPSWVMTLSTLVQVAACIAIGALAWFLYENAQLPTCCGGLGWQ